MVWDVSDWSPLGDEQMGSKSKTWLRSPDDDTPWLFKEPRPDTGEHWAEVVAADMAALLGVPHAKVCLGKRNGRPGILCQSLIPDRHRCQLIHGNEVLRLVDPSYPAHTEGLRSRSIRRGGFWKLWQAPASIHRMVALKIRHFTPHRIILSATCYWTPGSAIPIGTTRTGD